ncbi:MAG: helix-turn-helix transcriptional regulator [Sphingomonas sp.]|uniref:helix-turn-helix domain-containing protein n=1 Tax=Sphingomonas sp. TaxID=28214 RepID=UPI003562C08E
MTDRVASLSERERAVLRLLLAGHDAKSAANALGLSVHTVNERLRDARRKLGVSSSREAARLLCASGAGDPKFLGDKDIGVGDQGSTMAVRPRDAMRTAGGNRLFLYAGGAILMIFLTLSSILFWVSAPDQKSEGPAPAAAPRVVATYPARGDTIPSGPLTLSVTFDQPMREGSFSFVQMSAETYPACEPRPQVSADGRTFTLRCTTLPGRRYEIWFNRAPYMNFKSVTGMPAQPFQLVFRTR